jgi:hypothetical protein
MDYYVLSWGLDGGLITTDLTSGEQLLLVHTDRELALRYGSAIFQRTGRGVATITLNSSRSGLRRKLERAAGKGSLADVDLVFPDHPVYSQLVNNLLAGS